MNAESLRHRLGDMHGGDSADVVAELDGVRYEIVKATDEGQRMVLKVGRPLAEITAGEKEDSA